MRSVLVALVAVVHQILDLLYHVLMGNQYGEPLLGVIVRKYQLTLSKFITGMKLDGKTKSGRALSIGRIHEKCVMIWNVPSRL